MENVGESPDTEVAPEDIELLDGIEGPTSGEPVVRMQGFDKALPSRYHPDRLPVMDSFQTLYPSHLAYSTQHLILNEVQKVLENSCFDFVRKWLPQLLSQHGWDCAAAVELTKWTRLLVRSTSQISPAAFSVKGPSLRDILVGPERLRHAAVHRLPKTARQVRDMVRCSVKFAEVLQDNKRVAQLDELQQENESRMNAMELHKNALENGLKDRLDDIRRRRAELDQEEADSVKVMLKEDNATRSLIAVLLEELVYKILEKDCSNQVGSIERENFSENDSDGRQDTY